MGGNSNSRHVSFNEEVTFVKGIRLSERVIDRMKEPNQRASTKLSPSSPPVECQIPIMPHSPSNTSVFLPPVSEPVTPSLPVNEGTSQSTGGERVVVFPAESQPADPMTPVSSDPISAPQIVEATKAPAEPFISTVDHLPSPVSQLESSSSPVSASELTSVKLNDISSVEFETSSSIPDPVLHPPLQEELNPSSIIDPDPRLPPDEQPVLPSFTDQVEVYSPQTLTVNEDELRTQIRENLQKLLNEEMKAAELELRQQLEAEKAKAQAQAQADARLQIQDEVQKRLNEEKSSFQETLADALRREQTSVQDERLITQYYWMERKAQKLEEKEKDLENQEALFQQQIGRMKEKMAQFTKVTAENYKKGLEDAQTRFRRYQSKPVCWDLQSQILKCYVENKERTMSCSSIAALYIQCVDRARQDEKLNSGG